jgi:hypothetical protein
MQEEYRKQKKYISGNLLTLHAYYPVTAHKNDKRYGQEAHGRGSQKNTKNQKW